MATTTIKMGKRGTIVLPAKLRKQFGLEDGWTLLRDRGEGRRDCACGRLRMYETSDMVVLRRRLTSS